MLYFRREVGRRRVPIRDLPAGYDQLEALDRAYEAEHFRSNTASRRAADATAANVREPGARIARTWRGLPELANGSAPPDLSGRLRHRTARASRFQN